MELITDITWTIALETMEDVINAVDAMALESIMMSVMHTMLRSKGGQ